MRVLIPTLVSLFVPVLCFASGSRVDDSGLFVWAFLGFCSLIVIAQVLPAVLLLTGMLKGLASVAREEMVSVKQ